MGRIMIAGTNSGCGKTTIVCGILQAFVNDGLKTAGFKCGPDYIDPMFHREIIGTKSGNLDGFFMGKETLCSLLGKNSKDCDISVIEGVMGYYDGVGMTETASSYQVARDTETPVILVIPCKGASRSIQAMIKGFLEYEQDSRIRGIIFNELPESLYPSMTEYCKKIGVRPLGFFPVVKEARIESRHLGLVTAQEIGDLKEKVQKLAEMAGKYLDLQGILELAAEANEPAEGACEPKKNACQRETKINEMTEVSEIKSPSKTALRIAVARDRAFCFYYEDNLELLQSLGCELVEFSPLEAAQLPGEIDGLILGGGYPELYGEKLAANQSLLQDIRNRIVEGLPAYAECGGYIYLHEKMEDVKGASYKMVGVIEGTCRFTDRLQHFGYVTMTAKEDNLFCKKGEIIRAHEFHRCVSDAAETVFDTVKGEKHWDSFVAKDNLLAGFPHIHYYANPQVAKRFVAQCRAYRDTKDSF